MLPASERTLIAPDNAGRTWFTSRSAVPVSGNGRLAALIIAGYPIAWALGLGPMIFPLAAMFMVFWLIRHPPMLVPSGTVFFAVFLLLALASVVQINSPGRAGVWVLRTVWYASAFVTWLYLARQTSVRARRLIVYSLLFAWLVTVVVGVVAIIAPDIAWRSVLSPVLPGIIGGDEYVKDLINPSLAEIQSFYGGVTLNRPAGPYAYTNAWGSSFALLTPFVFAALQDRRLRLARPVVLVALLVGLVPFVQSLNRGAWLTLALGTVYGVIRYSVVARKLLPIVALVIMGTLLMVGAFASGAVDSAAEQLATRTADSDETRSGLYLDTIARSAESPLLGYGTPRPDPANPSGPPLGTHGQIWAVLFAHGYVAAFAYLGFFVFAFLRARGRDPLTHWAKVSLGIGVLQLPIYGHVPTQLFVMVTAAAIASWPPDSITVEETAVVDHRAVGATAVASAAAAAPVGVG